tara:strand:- start:835 stop:1260 length:426 start_codon:yes stop_codon:yes gene_type:complete
MSWATVYSGSNNIHFEQPALMSDSRMFTYYNSACKANEKLKSSVGIESNYEYRQYLISNGNRLRQENQERHNNTIGYISPMISSNANRNEKYLYNSADDTAQPYGYENSNLKNMYLTRYQLQARNSGPILTQEQLLNLRSK